MEAAHVCIRVRVPTATPWAKQCPGGLVIDTSEMRTSTVRGLRMNLFELQLALNVLVLEVLKLTTDCKETQERAADALRAYATYKPFAIVEANESPAYADAAQDINHLAASCGIANPAWPERREI